MPRLLHSAVSFAIVLVAYWIYALAAVPFIEPGIAGSSGSINEGGISEPSDDQRIKQFEGLFPPDAWELKNPKILENDKVKILLNDYKNLGDGRVELNKCTMVFPWDGPAEDEAQRKRQSVILEAPQGAILNFDKPIDLGSLRIGRLVGGYLKGPVIIRSQGKLPGPEDDLLIRTHDVQLSERKVWTPNPVDFTWGKNYGSGQDMHIKLLADPSKIGSDMAAPNVSGVEIFEMRHIKQLHLESNPSTPAGTSSASSSSPLTPSAPNQTDGFLSPAAAADLPVEITCDGAFTFDVVKRVATFAKNVKVIRLNPNGPSDQIQSEQLSIYFVPHDKSKPDSANSSNLEPERIEARGLPVLINAPTQNLTGQGERLEYNLKSNLISLDGGPVFLCQGANEIHGRGLQYQSLGPNRLGTAAAQGPGWLKGQMADNPDQRLEARWNDKLFLQPKDQYHIISFTGGAVLDYAGIGRLEAKEISFWLKETPSSGPSNQMRMQPHYMKAQNKVILGSARFSAAVDQLETWFEQNNPPREIPSPRSGSLNFYPVAANQSPPRSGSPNSSAVFSDQSPPLPGSNDAGQSQFKITGGKLQVRLQLQDQQSASLAEIIIEDRVSLEEIQNAPTGEAPYLIQGDRLHGTNVSSPNAIVKVTGRRAHFEGRGLGLSGSNINLNRGTNRLWIDGPGRMDLPLSNNNMVGQSLIPAQPNTTPGTLLIEWKKNMLFDGTNAKFEKSVSATTPQQHVQTETMEVKLKTPISFSDPNVQNQNQTEVEELRCYGGVLLENRSADPQGQPASFDRMQIANDLAVNMQSGALTAGGPGWLNRVNFGTTNPQQNQAATGLLGSISAAPTANSGAANPALSNNQLNCLHVRFQGSITGNLLRRELTFNDQIRAAYAPVFDWSAMIDPDKLESLGPQGIALHCDHLKVNQLPLPGGNGQTIEVEAYDNAVAEGGGGVFTARAKRITYAEVKNLLILEGDGRTDAELFRQPQPGANTSRFSARKFEYNLKTNGIKVIDARSLEILQPKN